MIANAIPLAAPETPPDHAIEVSVVKVFDGDGFLARIRTSANAAAGRRTELEVAVRLGFVDAPEFGQPGGIEARDFLTSLIGGRNVWLNILLKMDTGRSFDRYGRLVCVPYVRPGHADTLARNVELEMILNGWAWVVEKYGPDDRYLAALDNARANRRGIWARDGNMPPWVFKRQRRANACRGPRNPHSHEHAACPEENCGGHLIERNGRFGRFRGCSNYPTCSYSTSSARAK